MMSFLNRGATTGRKSKLLFPEYCTASLSILSSCLFMYCDTFRGDFPVKEVLVSKGSTGLVAVSAPVHPGHRPSYFRNVTKKNEAPVSCFDVDVEAAYCR